MRLEVEHLDVAYGRTQVLFDVSLTVEEGSLTCLMGRNGVGKTTLLDAICGLRPLKGGRVLIDGKDAVKLKPHERARMGLGYVQQGHQVFPEMTVRENLMVVLEGRRGVDPDGFDEALNEFPALVPMLGRPAGLLSGGQAQQLAIARALVTRPAILVLDEPTEGIQPSIIMSIEDTIARLHAQGLTILLVEQYVEFALRLADRFAVMEGGRIERSGDTATAEVATFSELLTV